MIWLKRLLYGVLIIATLLLGFWIFRDNQVEVPFVLLGFELGNLPLVIWVLVAFAIGAAVGVLLTLPASLHAKSRAKRYRQRLIDRERKLAKLEAPQQR